MPKKPTTRLMHCSYAEADRSGLVNHLYVYGTLRSDSNHRMHKVLSGSATFIGPARVFGRLYAFDAFPGMVTSEDKDDMIQGELYRLQRGTDGLLRRLDAYEGYYPNRPARSLFVRRIIVAYLHECDRPSAKPLMAWAYIYNGSVAEARRIVGGDYGEGLTAQDTLQLSRQSD